MDSSDTEGRENSKPVLTSCIARICFTSIVDVIILLIITESISSIEEIFYRAFYESYFTYFTQTYPAHTTPVHPGCHNATDSSFCISPSAGQENVTADARILYGAGNKGNVTYANRSTSERQRQGISFILNNRFRRVLVPQHDKLKNESVISLCKEGGMICRDIMSGTQVVPTKDNVVKVMWYLQACASDKVSSSAGLKYEGSQIFKMGAFSVEDNEHRLESFLNKAGAYRRKSSHLREYQKAGEKYQPAGLDIFSKNGYLPHNRKTILFERIPQKSHTTPTGIPGKNMLFIKMEEHGCHRKRDKLAHLRDFIPTLLEQRLGG
ncbi:hypothetical protein ACXOF6_004297 [Escherichia coli]|uniref:hypothetical protein n=1 Tax=Escherichia coli TaxID=562 RepID=UPI0020CA88E9|nr:hypothetical protein [Escherichia coli]